VAARIVPPTNAKKNSLRDTDMFMLPDR
jgi:hypothetical protein